MDNEETIELPVQRRNAELAPDTIDREARSVEVVWSTGATVRRSPWFGEPYDEVLSLDPAHVRLERLNAGAPFLQTHQVYRLEGIIGSVVPGSARIDNGRGIATVRLSEREDVEAIWRDIEAGHVRAVSVGYKVHRYDIEKPDSGVEVWRAVDWTPVEISAVPIGADPDAGIRSDHAPHDCILHRSTPAQKRHRKDSTMTDNTDTETQTREVTDASASANNATQTRQETVEQDAGATPTSSRTTNADAAAGQPQQSAADTNALVDEARRAERNRVSTIQDLVSRLGLERSIADDLVTRGVEEDEARRVILDRLAGQSDETRTFAHARTPLGGQEEQTTRREAVAGALLHRYSPDLFELGDASRQYRGMTLMELARESLSDAGTSVRGMSRDEVATRALHSTSDFPHILAAVTNRTLRQAYEAAPRTFMGFCRQVLATDFKAMHRVQMGEAPQLLKVAESGEFKRGSIGESKESYRIETYGRVVAITRQVLINDDLDAFTRIPAMYGNSIAQLESDVVWGIVTGNPQMADGKALFHEDHGNLAGTGKALTVAEVGKARAEMASQTGIDKKTVLNIRPAYLIVPAALELKAEQLLAQNLMPAQTQNVVPQSIRTLMPVAEPRLDAASAHAWYLAASPNQIDTIEYAYLEGQQGAYIETRNGFDVDGVEIKCRLDFGAKAIDWRGLYRNPGA